MSDPLVSIVLPTYNGSRHLHETVDSCFKQTYSNWEIIIVDDASEDDTPAIIDRLIREDSRIKTVGHQVNRKLPAALNTGFARAKGELLTWISDDNCYRERALEVMVNVLISHPNVDIVYSDCSFIDDEGNDMGYHAHCAPEFLPYRNCCGVCFLYRHAVHESLDGYDETLFLAEDYDFWLRASQTFVFHYLREDLVKVRIHPRSLSEMHQVRVKLAVRRSLDRCLREFEWSRSDRSLAYLRLARDATSLGQRVLALSYLFKGIWANPFSMMRTEFWIVIVLQLIGDKGYAALKRIPKIPK